MWKEEKAKNEKIATQNTKKDSRDIFVSAIVTEIKLREIICIPQRGDSLMTSRDFLIIICELYKLTSSKKLSVQFFSFDVTDELSPNSYI